MDINDPFQSKYLKASDLNGREIKVTMDDCVLHQMPDGDAKPVLSFVGKEKMLVLNKTNSMAIAEQHGTQTENWKGKQIIIFPTQTDFGGRVVPCIRVRLPEPDLTGQVPPAQDEIPF